MTVLEVFPCSPFSLVFCFSRPFLFGARVYDCKNKPHTYTIEQSEIVSEVTTTAEKIRHISQQKK